MKRLFKTAWREKRTNFLGMLSLLVLLGGCEALPSQIVLSGLEASRGENDTLIISGTATNLGIFPTQITLKAEAVDQFGAKLGMREVTVFVLAQQSETFSIELFNVSFDDMNDFSIDLTEVRTLFVPEGTEINTDQPSDQPSENNTDQPSE